MERVTGPSGLTVMFSGALPVEKSNAATVRTSVTEGRACACSVGLKRRGCH